MERKGEHMFVNADGDGVGLLDHLEEGLNAVMAQTRVREQALEASLARGRALWDEWHVQWEERLAQLNARREEGLASSGRAAQMAAEAEVELGRTEGVLREWLQKANKLAESL